MADDTMIGHTGSQGVRAAHEESAAANEMSATYHADLASRCRILATNYSESGDPQHPALAALWAYQANRCEEIAASRKSLAAQHAAAAASNEITSG